ncbi:putative rhamnogalacturonate lyase C [Tolypocladium ophioglossoides CBS 100239]|uniref:Putative rhamnogalacturonate lyase C n=1 Tax=Tolypocladium ophioglossoides (strain CBS 100239) TaxID=1163406 RepID=A0A0L0NJW5_TOLOC|nr:putative rhamnogalacturonate lyase C [Tolypocladium ophioglossoides CBS 100239]
MFGQRASSFEQLLNRPRRSAWREFLRAPCVFIARQLYLWQRRVPAEPLANPISVVCISDTHNGQPMVPDGDVLVHAGDLTQSGTALSWLSSLPQKHKIVLGGNHDTLLDVRRDDPAGQAGSKREQLAWGDIIYLNDESTIITCSNGRRLNVYGSPKSPKHGNWAFQYLRSEDVWTGKIPQDLDILITHGPPRAHLDLLNLGCVHLLRELWRTQPVLHVFGHVHEGYGSDWLNFDNVQQACERVIFGKGGMFNLLRVVQEFIRSLLTPVKEARCRLVNASSVGGLRDDQRRTPFKVFI